jgi:hypothetical protein
MWNGEHHVVIGTRQQFTGAVFYPLFFLESAAVGAMPVAATVVLHLLFAACLLIASI